MTPDTKYGLTATELKVIQAMVDGHTSNDAIAIHLGCSSYTVRHHFSNIFNKLGVDDRVGTLLFCLRRGIIALEVEVAV